MIENPDLNQLKISKGLDVALLIDCSGSMSGTKIEEAKKAAISFLNNFRVVNGSIGLITFPGGIIHKISQDFSSVKSKINYLSADNGTPMTEAIELAHSEMLSQTDFEKVIILLSDGSPDDSSSANYSAILAKNKGIRIITIGVSGADETFLKSIATSIKDYYFCNESFELESTFINIASQLTGSGLRKL
ncbi:MAG: VWA domain-containing protein [Chlorobiales bacterium]|nr:VWA domain-containing protein [Chlorobiales bacterium]